MNYKKMLAASLAATMVFGNAVVALAANEEGSTTGTGSLDIVENSDVFNVVLPAIPESGDTTFNYILDPTGVIKDTAAAKYSGATFADSKTVYFANVGTDATSYSDTSDSLTITNKSTMDVSVSVKATVKSVDGITMANSSTFDAGDKEAKLYLALKDVDTANTEQAIDADGAELTSTIQALAGAYETKYENGKYVKKLKDTATGFKTYSFAVTGACNPNGAWTGLTENPPMIDVIWSVADPTVKGPQVTLSTNGLITITGLTEAANVGNGATDILVGFADGEDTTLYPVAAGGVTWITDSWDATTGGTLKVQLNAGTYDPFNGQSINVSVKLTDGKTITANTTIGTVAE